MKVAIVAPSPVPYVVGGAQRLWAGLYHEINERTPHDAELINVPTPESTLPEVVAGYRGFAAMDLSHFDRVITTKYPAWMLPHHDHVVYLQHTLRGLYDTYHFTGLPEAVRHEAPDLAQFQSFLVGSGGRASLPEFFARWDDLLDLRGPDDPALAFPGPLARQIVHHLDRIALSTAEIRRHLAISNTVAARKDYFPPDAGVEAVPHPSNLEDFRSRGYGYFFTASRLDGAKRLDLLIRAMHQVEGPVHLKIAGTGPAEDHLRELAAGDPRIELLGYVTTDELLDLYAGALAVPFVPYDEDLGLITLEAMRSRRPVVTVHDAGGPTEFVVPGETGLIAEPTPESLAEALQRLVDDRGLARRMGLAAEQRALEVTWPSVVRRLLAPTTGAHCPDRRPGRDKVVVVTTFRIHPPRGGGPIRCAELYASLLEDYDVEVVALDSGHQPNSRETIAPGLVETVIPKSPAHEAWEHEQSREVGWVPVTDIAAARRPDLTPAYLAALEEATSDACAVVLAHPYLYPAVSAVAPGLPVIYDAHNVELDLKAANLPATEAGRRLVGWVRSVEAEASRASVLITACADADADRLAVLYELGRNDLVVVPNGVNTTAIEFIEAEKRAAIRADWVADLADMRGEAMPDHIAVFLASWHPPNLEAARILLHAAKRTPEVLFAMVGTHTDYFRDWQVPDNVLMLGMVSDTVKATLLACADVALNPMISGSGSNLKVLEYFAAGVPVISTPFGTRGFSAVADEHYIAADVSEFDRVLRETMKRGIPDGMVKAARELVEARYDWRVIGVGFREAVSAALRERIPTGVR